MFCNHVYPQMQKLRESLQVLKNDQGKRSKEFFAKREEHHANNFRELQNTSNKKLEESSTKLGEANATIESLTKQLQNAKNTIVAKDDEMSDLRGNLDEANQSNKNLEEKIVNLKTSHGKEKDGYQTKIAQLEKSLEFAKEKNACFDLGLKMEHELGNEKKGHDDNVTRLEEKLEVAKGDRREYEEIYVSESDKIKTGMVLLAGAKEGEPEDLLGAGRKVLVSVHKALSDRPQSKASRRRANKRKRIEMGLDMERGNKQHNGNIEDDEVDENVEGNDADGSFQLQERV